MKSSKDLSYSELDIEQRLSIPISRRVCDGMSNSNDESYGRVPRANQSRTVFSKSPWDVAVSALSSAGFQQLSSMLLPYPVGVIHRPLCPSSFQPFLQRRQWKRAWTYWIDDRVGCSFDLYEVVHLSLGHWRGTTWSPKFAQYWSSDIEPSEFEAIIRVEIPFFLRLSRVRTRQHWLSATAGCWWVWSGDFKLSPRHSFPS